MVAPQRSRRSALEAPAHRGAALNSTKVIEECFFLLTVLFAMLLSTDGKFILELERAREGERVSWVSVPRKTFWPPQGTAASTPSYRQESSTSLSGT